MNIKFQLPNAVKLFFLLCLLFWSLTWNIEFDLSEDELCTSCKEGEFNGEISGRSEAIFLRNAKDDLKETNDPLIYDSMKSGKSVSESIFPIPSFKEWREMEISKYEKESIKDKNFHPHKRFTHRKLNYASSKCGAKILASNPEARHRMAVLSEKSDEYFLNPCRVKTWFIIELCDAVEVTQIELANYELYSSSYKEFSVFWSEMYPTFSWHHLGSFVAADKKTMQTFDVIEKNMGKFIKVIINSYHGREHYCPLSVIRVLGYSMVEKFEVSEHEEQILDSDLINEAEMISPNKKPIFQRNIDFSSPLKKYTKAHAKSMCFKFLMNCSIVSESNTSKLCFNKPLCPFLEEILKKSNIKCLEFYSPRLKDMNLKGFSTSSTLKFKIISSSLITLEHNKSDKLDDFLVSKDIIQDYEHKKALRLQKENKIYIPAKGKVKNFDSKIEKYNYFFTIQQSRNYDMKSKSTSLYDCVLRTSNDKFKCDNNKNKLEPLRLTKITTNDNFGQKQRDSSDDIDSAGLINKESVLFKLGAKIRTLETDLNLVNKYLDKLSQSYRHQIEDIKIKLNKNFRAINESSTKTILATEKQEKSINILTEKIGSLNRKINFLLKGRNESVRKVFELHGFFLILEIIILFTIFNVFLNVLYK